MPRVPVIRKLPANTRADLDAEIRRRGYGDLQGLVKWLADRGTEISKSSIHKYAQKLRAADESTATPELSQEAARLIVECAALALKTFRAFERALGDIRDEQFPTPYSLPKNWRPNE